MEMGGGGLWKFLLEKGEGEGVLEFSEMGGLRTDKAMELKFCIVILQCIMNVLSEIDFLKS